MSRNWTRFAPFGYLVALIALVATGAWYVVNRQFDVPVRIGLGLAVLGLAAGILLDPDRVLRALTGRQARYGSNALLATLAFAGILAVANFLVYSSPQTLDLTEDKQYSLSPETQLTLATLKEPVVIKGFYTPDLSSSRDSIRPLLEQYQRRSGGKLTYEFLDPRADPVAADKYGVTTDGTLVVVMGTASQLTTSSTEADITSAIVRLENPEQRKIYFLTGHGEHDIKAADDTGFSQLASALEAKNYKLDTLSLLSDATVPQDALEVVVAGPEVPLSDAEVKSLGAYLDAGGSVVVLEEPTVATRFGDATDPLAAYLDHTWGIRLNDDLVVDLRSNNPLLGIAARYGDDPITSRMGNLATVFPTARSITLATTPPSGVSLTALVYTGSNSWGKTDKQAIANGALANDPKVDNPGPLVLAAAGEDQAKKSRLVVIGDADFATNAAFTTLGNGDLLVNSLDWAARQDQLINLTPKQSTSRFVTPPTVQAVGLIGLITILGIPGGVVVLGVVTWFGRRKRA
jgi:ABC-type uncharacterized transport system involved in gliding motility auxiliary subunit